METKKEDLRVKVKYIAKTITVGEGEDRYVMFHRIKKLIRQERRNSLLVSTQSGSKRTDG